MKKINLGFRKTALITKNARFIAISLVIPILMYFKMGFKITAPVAIITLTLVLLGNKIVVRLKKLNYYSSIERELPFINTLLLISSLSRARIDEFFSRIASINVFPYMKIEAEKFLSLLRVGRTPEEALVILYERCSSERYKRFLRGLLTVESTSMRIPEYAHTLLKESYRELSDRWKRFWELSISIVEIVMIMGIAVMTLTMMGLFINSSLYEKLTPVFIIIISLTSTALLMIEESIRPLSRNKYSKKTMLFSISSIVASIILVLVAPLSLYEKMLIAGVVLCIGGAPLVFEEKFISKSIRSVLQKMRELIELVKVGYSYQKALEDSGIAEEVSSIRSRGLSTFLIEYSSVLIESIRDFGAASYGALESMYFFLRDVVSLQESFKRNSLIIQLSSIILPALLLVLSIKAIFSMTCVHIPYIQLVSPEKIVNSLIEVFAVISIASSMLVANIIDDSLLATHRVGLALIAIGLASIIAVKLNLGLLSSLKLSFTFTP